MTDIREILNLRSVLKNMPATAEGAMIGTRYFDRAQLEKMAKEQEIATLRVAATEVRNAALTLWKLRDHIETCPTFTRGAIAEDLRAARTYLDETFRRTMGDELTDR